MRWLALPVCFAFGLAFGQQDPGETCLSALPGDVRFAPIAAHVALGKPQDASAGMLADLTRPGAKERERIAAWSAARQGCFAASAGFRRQNYPAILAAVAADGERRLDAATQALLSGKFGYGEFNRLRKDIAEEAVAMFRNAVLQLRHERQISGRGQRRTAELSRLEADRQAVRKRQVALAEQRRDAASRRRLEESARQAAENLGIAQARDSQARSLAATEFRLNTTRPPYDYPAPSILQPSPNMTCRPVGNAWNCVEP